MIAGIQGKISELFGASAKGALGQGFAMRLLEQLTLPAFVLDADHKVMLWNEAMEELTGVKAGRLLGTNEHWRAFYPTERPCLADLAFGSGDDRSKLYENMDQGAATRGLQAENWVELGGERRYVVINAAPIRDETGRIIAVVETIRDITSQKMAQEELKETQARQEAAFSRIVGTLGEALAKLADGRLSVRVRTELPGVDRLRSDFNAALETISATLESVMAEADHIRLRGEELSKAADALSLRTERQAAGLEEASTALSQITATVQQTADSAGHARSMTHAAADHASRSEETARKAISAMREIETFSRQISHIVEVIDAIAFQTNLLAVNAGVEAARAGEAGRGFAVVATEVRILAQRSASAAREINGLITSSSRLIEDGVSLVARSGEDLKHLFSEIGAIRDGIDRIAEGAREQATSLKEIHIAIREMDTIGQQNSAMAEATNAVSRTLLADSARLEHALSALSLAADDEEASGKVWQAA